MNKYLIETNSVCGGTQKLYKFDNGFGASVVKSSLSYGNKKGEWELAVIVFDDEGCWDLC